jgi:hypothetical protein
MRFPSQSYLPSNTAIHLSRHRDLPLSATGFLRPGDGQRSKDVSCLMAACKAALRGRSQEATVNEWLKSARQSGSSDGLQVSVI